MAALLYLGEDAPRSSAPIEFLWSQSGTVFGAFLPLEILFDEMGNPPNSSSILLTLSSNLCTPICSLSIHALLWTLHHLQVLVIDDGHHEMFQATRRDAGNGNFGTCLSRQASLVH